MSPFATQKITPTCIQDIHLSSSSAETYSASQDGGAFPSIHMVTGTLRTDICTHFALLFLHFHVYLTCMTEAPKDNQNKDEDKHTQS